VPKIFHWRAKTEWLKAESGDGVLAGAATPSPPDNGVWGPGGLRALPAGFGTEPQPPKGFPLFSALRMASPDTIILLM